jgi:hypothetical protein
MFMIHFKGGVSYKFRKSSLYTEDCFRLILLLPQFEECGHFIGPFIAHVYKLYET